MVARNVERHVALSRRLTMLHIAVVGGFPCATSNLCKSWPGEVAALQALHSSRMKVKIAGSAAVNVVVALGAELLIMNSVKSAGMAAARTARKG